MMSVWMGFKFLVCFFVAFPYFLGTITDFMQSNKFKASSSLESAFGGPKVHLHSPTDVTEKFLQTMYIWMLTFIIPFAYLVIEGVIVAFVLSYKVTLEEPQTVIIEHDVEMNSVTSVPSEDAT